MVRKFIISSFFEIMPRAAPESLSTSKMNESNMLVRFWGFEFLAIWVVVEMIPGKKSRNCFLKLELAAFRFAKIFTKRSKCDVLESIDFIIGTKTPENALHI